MNGAVQLWDFQKLQIIQEYTYNPFFKSISIQQNNNDNNSNCRIGCIDFAEAFNSEDKLFCIGSKDKMLRVYDVRTKFQPIKIYAGHEGEVCGAKWSYDGKQIATGGNDNLVIIWNFLTDQKEKVFKEHVAGIKALAWNPQVSYSLLTGGGTQDKTIKMWNTMSHQLIQSYNTKSQVCGLVFSKNSNHFISTHGYATNDIKIWDITSQKFTEQLVLEGHDARVLYVAQDPTGSQIVTGAGDETLKIWQIFPEGQKNIKLKKNQLQSTELR